MRCLTMGALALAFLTACHEEEPPPPTVSIAVDPTIVALGGTTNARITVTDFELLDPGAAHTESGDDHHEEGGVARQGHYHVYLDTTDENPLVMDYRSEIELTLDAAPGEHELIVRLNDVDHRIILPEVRDSAAVTIQPAFGAGGAGGTGGAGGSGGGGGAGGG